MGLVRFQGDKVIDLNDFAHALCLYAFFYRSSHDILGVGFGSSI